MLLKTLFQGLIELGNTPHFLFGWKKFGRYFSLSIKELIT